MIAPHFDDVGRDGFSIKHILRNGRISDFEVIPHAQYQGALNSSEDDGQPLPAFAPVEPFHHEVRNAR